MLAAKELIKALNNDTLHSSENIKNNEDYDFENEANKVFEFYSSRTVGHKLKYSDGKEYIFSFDD